VAELVSQPTPIQSIYNWFREGKLFVNRRYQRKLVWSLEEKQKLIESILKKYPIPAILIAERETEGGTYEIIDGLQRLHAIVSFIETSFSTLDDKYFNLELFPTAKSLSESGVFVANVSTNKLVQKEVSKILDYSLALSVMRNATEDQINDVFDRINTYGHRLSDQERRQAGVQNEFSNLVRQVSCELRGDVSDEVLLLSAMPSISIDLPTVKHGYEVRAEEVFWVQQGILRSTDLRDSMDEQCIADILACILGDQLIARTKDSLDAIYIKGSRENTQIIDALNVYGALRIAEEFKYCIDEIKKICAINGDEKLRDILFKKRTTNPFPSLFAILFIAVHEMIVKENNVVTDYQKIRNTIDNIADRIESGKKGGTPSERRKNIDTVKGLIARHFIKAKDLSHIYGSHSTIDIESSIRRSEIELSHYELKQGLLSLSKDRKIDTNLLDKVINTICAIANNGPKHGGKILIGVTDKDADAERIKKLDGIEPRKIGKRFVVGVSREAKSLKISLEDYFSKWKDGIRSSELSVHLRDGVLSNVDFHEFYGLGVITFTIPPQTEMSYVGEDTYWRNVDSTEKATSAKQIASIAKRF
jgi:hypothetical protein